MENKLIARMSVLYLSRLYKVGDELPTSDPVMVQACLEAGSAVWESGEAPAKKPTAKPVTAEPGLPGKAEASETDDNLVGKVPKTSARKK